jgi:S1-C subfamily serine protease
LVAVILTGTWVFRPTEVPSETRDLAPPTAPASDTGSAGEPAAENPVAPQSPPPVTPSPPDEPESREEAGTTTEGEPSIEDMVSKVIPAVVLVQTPSGRGSGFFVGPDTIVTNVHVVGLNNSVTVRAAGGKTIRARVASLSDDFDIAILKIANPRPDQPTISLGSARDARVGQEVIAIGSALGTLQNTVTRGIVSGVRQSGTATLVQTDAAVNPGNSGGPLLTRAGTVIGITTMGYTDHQGLNFAVAADHARDVLDDRTTPSLTGNGPDDLKNLSPAVDSESERRRAASAEEYDRAMATLARHADALDDYWERFRASCFAGLPQARFDREWFVVYRDVVEGAAVPGCGSWLADVKKRALTIRSAAVEAEETARRADVYPGVRRDTRRKYRLDYPG